MTTIPQLLTLSEASAYLAQRGILTRDGTPYNPGTLKTLCRRGDFPNAQHVWLKRNHTRRPVWHIPTSDLDNFTPSRDRPKPGYSTKEAAEILGLQAVTVETKARTGKIKGIKQGHDWFFTDEAIAEYRNRKRVRIETKERAKQERVDPGPEKACKRCGNVKPIDRFRRNTRYVDGYESWCKDCHAEYRSQPDQKAKRSERGKKRYADPEYRTEHQEKNNARYRERWRRDAEFRKRKNDQKAMFNHGRRTRKRQGDLTVEQWRAICEHYGNRCLCCGKEGVTLDHIKPVSRGGEHTASNVQPLCGTCNTRKMTKEIDYRPDKGEWVRAQQW